MPRRGIAFGGLAAIVGSCVALALWQAPRIERDLAVRVEQSLAHRGMSGVEVRFDGRDAILAGPGVTERVVALVAEQRGVRRVRVGTFQRLPVAPPATGAPAGSGDGGQRGTAAEPPAQVARQLVELLGPTGLRFAAGGAELTASQRHTLDRIAALLVANPSVRLEVAGYTDTSPAPGLTNLELSRQRAAAVAGHLVAGGVAAARLTVQGHGDARPVGDNGVDAGRAANRRVEITVLGG